MLSIMTTFCTSIRLYAREDLNASNGAGGTYLWWTDLGSKDIIYRVMHCGSDNIWKSTSVFAEGDKVNVLNVYPSECKKCLKIGDKYKTYNVIFKFAKDNNQVILPKSASLKIWMEGGTIIDKGVEKKFDPYGIDPKTKKQLIFVTLMSIDEFEENPNAIFNYDVTVFGTWDANACVSITTETAQNVVSKYIDEGFGVLAGHDTLSTHFYDYRRKPLGLASISSKFGIETNVLLPSDFKSDKIKIEKKGLLTNYPWKIGDINDNLTIPEAHINSATFGNIWMSFYGDWRVPEYTIIGSRKLLYNFYLSSYNNAAMIQTGHSNCDSTEDERKLIANTIYYLKQRTTRSSLTIHETQDINPPAIHQLMPNYEKNLIYLKSHDFATRYQFKVEAINISTNIVVNKSNKVSIRVKTNLAGHYYLFNKFQSFKITTKNSITCNKTLTNIINIFEKYCNLNLHVAPYDHAGNIGTTKSFNITNKWKICQKNYNNENKKELFKGKVNDNQNKKSEKTKNPVIMKKQEAYSTSNNKLLKKQNKPNSNKDKVLKQQKVYSKSINSIKISNKTHGSPNISETTKQDLKSTLNNQLNVHKITKKSNLTLNNQVNTTYIAKQESNPVLRKQNNITKTTKQESNPVLSKQNNITKIAKEENVTLNNKLKAIENITKHQESPHSSEYSANDKSRQISQENNGKFVLPDSSQQEDKANKKLFYTILSLLGIIVITSIVIATIIMKRCNQANEIVDTMETPGNIVANEQSIQYQNPLFHISEDDPFEDDFDQSRNNE